MVAQEVVGTSSCFILDFAHYRHCSGLFRNDCYLKKETGFKQDK